MENNEPENIEYSAPNLIEKIETTGLVQPTPNNPPWNGWAAVAVWAASVLFILLFPNFFLLPYLSRQNLNFSDQAQLVDFINTDPTAIVLRLAAIIPAHLFTLLFCWAVVTRFNKYSFRETLGWNWNGFKIWHSLAIFVFFFITAILLTLVFGDVENEFERLLKSSRIAVYFVAFFAVFTAPLVEEVVYRGLLYSAFQRRFGVILAVLFVTILFTIVHVPQYSDNSAPDYATVITLLLLSLTLTLVRVWTNNLLPCIVLHTVINLIQSLLLIFQPFLEKFSENPGQQTAMFLNLLK